MLRNELYKPWFVEDKMGFEVISGDFLGVVIQLDKVEFAESEDGNLNIEYHTIHKPEIISEDLTKSDLFKSTFELIVNDIVREAIETLDEERRNDNPSEPSPQ